MSIFRTTHDGGFFPSAGPVTPSRGWHMEAGEVADELLDAKPRM